jgi:hypothetical protein
LQEFPAIVEPALRDIPEPPDSGIEGWELVDTERVALPSATEVVQVTREVALADDRVRRLVADKRYVVLGASRLSDDKERESPTSVLLMYNYTDEQTYRVWLSDEDGDLRVRDVEEIDEQPQASDEEIERAIGIAREADSVRRHLGEGFEANALLASAVEPGDRHYGRRRIVVGFGPADERLPRVRVLVDLSAEKVLAVDASGDELEEGQR